AESARKRRRGGVGVDVVDLAVEPTRTGRDDGDPASVEQRVDRGRVDADHVPDESDVGGHAVDDRVAPLGGEEVGVLAAHADGEGAVRVERTDDLAVDVTDEHHPYDLHHLRGGDAEATLELRLEAEVFEVRADLRTAAVHDDDLDAGVAKEDDVL